MGSDSILSTFQDIASRFSHFLVDVTGVVHDGINPYPEAVQSLNALSQEKTVIFFSNIPRPGNVLRKRLETSGITSSFECWTSGDAARVFLSQNPEAVFYHLGAARNQDILQDLTVKTTLAIDDADYVLLTAFVTEDEPLDRHDELFQKAAQRNVPILCTNPDTKVIHGTKNHFCSGSLAERAATYGCQVLHFGKPGPRFYQMCPFLKNIEKSQIVMIGDTLETDIEGAKNFGIASVLVCTGNAGRDLKGDPTPENITLFLRNRRTQPSFCVRSLL